MLPSSNKFRAYFCPYFQTSSCQRPYCHFKHELKQIISQNLGSDDASIVGPYMCDDISPESGSTSLDGNFTLHKTELKKCSLKSERFSNDLSDEKKSELKSLLANARTSLSDHQKQNSTKKDGIKSADSSEKTSSKRKATDEYYDKPGKYRLCTESPSKHTDNDINEVQIQQPSVKSIHSKCDVDDAFNQMRTLLLNAPEDKLKSILHSVQELVAPLKRREKQVKSHEANKKQLRKNNPKLSVKLLKQDIFSKKNCSTDASMEYSDSESSQDLDFGDCNNTTSENGYENGQFPMKPKFFTSKSEEEQLCIEDYASEEKKRIAHPKASNLTNNSKRSIAKVKQIATPQQQLLTRYLDKKNNKNGEEKVDKSPSSLEHKRTAHRPLQVISFVPLALINEKSFLSMRSRRMSVEKLYEEFKQIDESSALENAKDEELSAGNRATSQNVYRNLIAQAIAKIRQRINSSRTKTESRTPSLKVSHQAILAGANAVNISYNARRQRQISLEDISEADFYNLLFQYTLKEDELKRNGYPVITKNNSGDVFICRAFQNWNKHVPVKQENGRICDRCSKEFIVDENGVYLTQEECIYHWGRLRERLVQRNYEKKYTCCGGDDKSVGCSAAKLHVFRGDNRVKEGPISGFSFTQPKALSASGSYGIYALDCEMSYTCHGLELTRVSVVNHKKEIVYERYVRPDHPIIDYNTRWSGVTEKHLHGVTTTIRDVNADLLELFSDRTILIGHSLESDLIALKLAHSVVVDTSIMFPHRLGWPYKRGLRELLGEYLKKIIQNDAEGHDSFVDAVSCMELVMWKMKEDLKSGGIGLLNHMNC